MSMYKTIFWSEAYEDYASGDQVSSVSGDVLVFGESAFASLDEAVAYANGTLGGNAIIVKVASGKYDSYTVVNNGTVTEGVKQVMAVDFGGGNFNYDNGEYSREVTMEAAGFTAEEQSEIVDALNADAADGIVYVAGKVAGNAVSTIYVGSTESFKDLGDFSGISETVDKDNQLKNDEAFVMVDKNSSVSDVIGTIKHEAGHLMGESHEVTDGTINDFALTDADLSKFYVNTAYADLATGTAIEGMTGVYAGINAFGDYDSALNAAADGTVINVVGSNPDTFYVGKSDSETDVVVNFTGDVKALWKNMVRVDAGSTGNVINGSTLEYASFGVRGTLNAGSETGEKGIVTGKNFNVYGENGYPAAEINVYAGSTLQVDDGSQNTSFIGHGSDANRKGELNILGGTASAKYLKVNAGTGKINVENGTLNVVNTLTNNGTVNVSGESSLNLGNVSGQNIVVDGNATLKDSTIKGVSLDVAYRNSKENSSLTLLGTNSFSDLWIGETGSLQVGEAGDDKERNTADVSVGNFYVRPGGAEVNVDNASMKVTSYGNWKSSLTANNAYIGAHNDIYVYDNNNAGLLTWELNDSELEIKSGYDVSIGGKDGIAPNGNAKLILNKSSITGGAKLNIAGAGDVSDDGVYQYTANGSSMEINSSTVDLATLNIGDGGSVSVSGTSDVKANVTGDGWIYMDDVTLDADTQISGGKVRFASGENNINGSVINATRFHVGTGHNNAYVDPRVDSENGVTVNVTNGAYIHGDDGEYGAVEKGYGAWVGTSYSGVQNEDTTNAPKFNLNIADSVAEFGYLHVSNDGVLNVEGHVADDMKIKEGAVVADFYAGRMTVNGSASFSDVDGWVAGALNISCDNSNNVTPGKLEIADGATLYVAQRGDQKGGFTIYNNGEISVSGNSTLETRGGSSVGENAKLAVDGSALIIGGTLTNNGTFTVSGESTLKIANLSGDADITDAELQDGSYITNGNGTVYFNGDNAIDGAVTIGSEIYNYGKLDVKDGATFTNQSGKITYLVGFGASLNVAENATVKVNDLWNNVQGSAVSTIDGTAEISHNAWLRNATINGSLSVENQLAVYSNDAFNVNGELTINGNGSPAGWLIGNPGSSTGAYAGNITVNVTGGTVNVTGNSTGEEIIIQQFGILNINPDAQGKAGTVSVNGIITNKGDVNITDGSMTSNYIINNSGTMNVTDGVISASSIANTGTINLTVTDKKLATIGNDAYYIINQTGNGAALNNTVTIGGEEYSIGQSFTKDGVEYSVTNGTGNDIAIQALATVFFVDASYDENTAGYGFNKFSSFDDAVKALKNNDTVIKLFSDAEMSETTDPSFKLNVVSGDGSKHTLKINDATIDVDANFAEEIDIDTDLFMAYYNNHNVVVDGDLKGGIYNYGGTLTFNNSKITNSWDNSNIFGVVNINGDGSWTLDNAQADNLKFIGIGRNNGLNQGILNLNDTVIKAIQYTVDSQSANTKSQINAVNSTIGTVLNDGGWGHLVVTANGEVNLTDSNLNILGTLTNNGTVNVTGTGDLVANVTGNGTVYMDGVTLDADTKLDGANVRFASGVNTIDGATIDNGKFQIGQGGYNDTDTRVDTANGVTVNVKNNAVIDSSGNTYAGWIGTGFYDTDAEKAAVMTDARYTLNIDNSTASFGYMHISNDGIMNVTGVADTKEWYNNSDYSYYAGDFIINGTAKFDGADVLAFYTKVSCDNGTDKGGHLIITNGTYYEAESHDGADDSQTNLEVRKTGVVDVNGGSTLYVGGKAIIQKDAVINVDNANFQVTGTVTNDGAINVADSAIKAAEITGSGTFTIGAGNTELQIGSLNQDVRANENSDEAITLTGNIGTANKFRVYGDATLDDFNVNASYTGQTVSATGQVLVYGDTVISDSTMNLNYFQSTGSVLLESGSTIRTANIIIYDMQEDSDFVVQGNLEACTFIVVNDYYNSGSGSEVIIDKGGVLTGLTQNGNGRFDIQSGNMTVYGTVNGSWNGGGGTAFIGNSGLDASLTVDGAEATFVNSGTQNLIVGTDGVLNVVNGATFDWTTNIDNSGSITVDASSSFSAGSIVNNGTINGTKEGEMIVLGDMTVTGNINTETLTLNAGAALSVGSLTVDNLNLAIGSDLSVTGTGSSIGTVTITGELVPENAEFVLVSTGWTGLNENTVMYKDKEYTVTDSTDNLAGINFVVKDGSLYVKDFGAATTGIYIGELPEDAQPGDKITTDDGATYTVGEDAFANATDAANALGDSAANITSINLGDGEHVDDVAATFVNVETITIDEGVRVVDTAPATFAGDLVINNNGHLDAYITAGDNMTITNTSVNTLLGSYTSDAEITVDNDGGMIGKGTYGVDDPTKFNTVKLTVNDGDAVNVEVNAEALELNDTNTFGLNANSGIFNVDDIWGEVRIILNGSANMSIDGDIAGTNVDIDSVLEDHTGTVTLKGEQTFNGNITAHKIVVADGKEVTFNLNTVDFKELNIEGTLNTDFTAMGSDSDAGALTGTGTLNTTHTGAWIVNDSVTRDVSGFTGKVTMADANASIVLGNGDFDENASAEESYFSNATVTVNGNQKVVLAGDGVNTATTYTGNGTINVGEYADKAFAEQAENFSQTLSGDNSGFEGTINVSEGAQLTIANALGASSIDMDYETTQSATGVATEFDTQLILNQAGLDLAAQITGDANDIIDVAENAALTSDAALNNFAGTVAVNAKELTLGGENETAAKFTGTEAGVLNVNANNTLTADNTDFIGTVNIGKDSTLTLKGDLSSDEKGTIKFTDRNSKLDLTADEANEVITIGSKLDNSALASGFLSNVVNVTSDAELTAEGALNNYRGKLDVVADTTLTLSGNNTTQTNIQGAGTVALADGADPIELTLRNDRLVSGAPAGNSLMSFSGTFAVNDNKLNILTYTQTGAAITGTSDAELNISKFTVAETGKSYKGSLTLKAEEALNGFDGTINLTESTLNLTSANTTNAVVNGDTASELNISDVLTLNTTDAISGFNGTVQLYNADDKLTLIGTNSTAATVKGAGVIDADANQTFSGDVSGFSGLYDIAENANVTLSGTIADEINAQGDTLTLSNEPEPGKVITVNAGDGSDLDNLAFGENNVKLGVGDGDTDDFTNVTGEGDILDFGDDQTFGTVEAGTIYVTGSEDALIIKDLDANINITVDAAQAGVDNSDVTITDTFTGDISVTIEDPNALATSYKIATNGGFDTDTKISLTVGGSTADLYVDDRVIIDDETYLLKLKDDTLILSKLPGYSNYIVVDGDWTDKVPYQSVDDNGTERIIGYDAAYDLTDAVGYIRGYDKGVNANAGTNPGDATIELTGGKYTLAAGTTLMNTANEVTQLILDGRDGQTATLSGVVVASDGRKETTLTMNDVRIQGELYGGGTVIINNAANLRTSGNVIAAGAKDSDMANDSSLVLNGGYFGNRVIAGGSVNTVEGTTITVDGDSSLVIDNQSSTETMVITGNLVGGSWAANGTVVQNGEAEILVNVENATQIRGNIFVNGGEGKGELTVNGDSKITFTTDDAKLLTFTGTVNAISSAYTEEVVFDNFEGEFNGSFAGFDVITIEGSTSLELGRRQNKTGDTSLAFVVNSDSANNDNDAMYTVRDANNWEFKKDITITTDAFAAAGDYVLVNNYKGGFEGFTFTIDGITYNSLEEAEAAGLLTYENNQLIYTNSATPTVQDGGELSSDINDTAVKLSNVTNANGVQPNVTGKTVVLENTKLNNATISGSGYTGDINISVDSDSVVGHIVGTTTANPDGDIELNVDSMPTTVYGVSGAGASADDVTINVGFTNGKYNFVAIGTGNVTINGDSVIVVEDGAKYSTGNPEILVGGIYGTSTGTIKGDTLVEINEAEITTNNSVATEGGNIVGGGSGTVEGNSGVVINGATIDVKGSAIYGGAAWGGKVSDSYVTVNGGEITLDSEAKRAIYGGSSSNSYTTDSATVTINDGDINANIYGGSRATAVANTKVVINGGDIDSTVIGAAGFEAAATAGTATVEINDGSVTATTIDGAKAKTDSSILDINGGFVEGAVKDFDQMSMDVDAVLNGTVTGVDTLNVTGLEEVVAAGNVAGAKTIVGEVDDVLAGAATIDGNPLTSGKVQLAGADDAVGTGDDIWASLTRNTDGSLTVAWGRTETEMADALDAFNTESALGKLALGDAVVATADTLSDGDNANDFGKKSNGTLA